MLANTPDREKTTAEAQETLHQEGMLEVIGTLSPEHQAIFPVEAQTFLSLLCAQFASETDTLRNTQCHPLIKKRWHWH